MVWKAGSAQTSQQISDLLGQIKVRILMLFPKKSVLHQRSGSLFSFFFKKKEQNLNWLIIYLKY